MQIIILILGHEQNSIYNSYLRDLLINNNYGQVNINRYSKYEIR